MVLAPVKKQHQLLCCQALLCCAEHCARLQAGRRQKKGMHSSKEAPMHHVNDVSLPGQGTRAKQYLPFFQRGRVAGIVEFVLSGHRLKARPVLCFAWRMM